MYNAERTVAETLTSICRQTYRSLDIVVVDDGSVDASAEIAASFRERDPRVRLLRQRNGGVAVARNNGAAATDAEFLAFVDADDLWAPAKIELQMQALRRGGPSAGLAYCWFAQIDGAGRVFSLINRPQAEGRVLGQMCRSNFVGNGSSMLVRRRVFEEAGQFDPSLRARRAQGCEDLLMCLRIAESHEFRVVPQFLVGYRITDANMSSDVMQMLRSCEIVLADYHRRYPQYGPELDAHLVDMVNWLVIRAFIAGNFLDACALLKKFFALDPGLATTRLPSMMDVYCRARLAPRWFKAGLRRLSGKDGEYRPLFGELVS